MKIIQIKKTYKLKDMNDEGYIIIRVGWITVNDLRSRFLNIYFFTVERLTEPRNLLNGLEIQDIYILNSFVVGLVVTFAHHIGYLKYYIVLI